MQITYINWKGTTKICLREVLLKIFLNIDKIMLKIFLNILKIFFPPIPHMQYQIEVTDDIYSITMYH